MRDIQLQRGAEHPLQQRIVQVLCDASPLAEPLLHPQRQFT